MRKAILLLTICLICLSSCSIEKRIYRPGFSISGNHSKIRIGNTSEKNNDVSKSESHSEEQSIERPTSELNILEENFDYQSEEIKSSKIDDIENSENENNNVIEEEYENNANQNNLEPLECDVIVCKNGDEIEAKILEIGIKEIKYKRCDNQEGPTISILNSSVLMIKYPNGTKDIIKSNVSNDYDEPKMNLFSTLSLIFGFLSLFTVFGGLLFGPLAIIFSEQAFKELIKESDKFKSNSANWAKTGKVLGLIGLFISLIIIVILFL
jgi:hypothetical protein